MKRQTPQYPKLYTDSVNEIKRRVVRWPSAYASGQLVQLYKKKVAKAYGPRAQPYKETISKHTPLGRWYDEEWIDIVTKKPCGSVKSSTYYPVCRPKAIANRLTEEEIIKAYKIKQRVKSKTASYPSFFKRSKQ